MLKILIIFKFASRKLYLLIGSLCIRLWDVQNHVERIFPEFLDCLHLQANWWSTWHMLSEMKSLPVNFSWLTFSDLLRRFFQSTRSFRFSFLQSWTKSNVTPKNLPLYSHCPLYHIPMLQSSDSWLLSGKFSLSLRQLFIDQHWMRG